MYSLTDIEMNDEALQDVIVKNVQNMFNEIEQLEKMGNSNQLQEIKDLILKSIRNVDKIINDLQSNAMEMSKIVTYINNIRKVN